MAVNIGSILKGFNLNKMISQLLATAAFLAVSASSAMAVTVSGSNLDVSVDYFTPISQTGNSFTFSGNQFVLDGMLPNMATMSGFSVQSHQGQALTGKISYTMELAYQMDLPPGEYDGQYNAVAQTYGDIYAPMCEFCSPMDAPRVGETQGFASASSTGPSSGFLTITSSVSPASGQYNLLYFALAEYYTVEPAWGSFTVKSLTINFDTVDLARPALASAVPELPPMAMFGAGVLALGLHARLRKSRASKNVA